jgi:exodeoxyribonuclease VII large subunit
MRANTEGRRVAIAQGRDRVNALLARADRALNAALDRLALRLDHAEGLLAALSYQGVLARGFALVRDAAGTPLRSASALTPGTALDIEFADGRVAAVAGTAAMKIAPAPSRRRRGPVDSGQGTLF